MRLLVRDVNGGKVFLRSMTPHRKTGDLPYLSEPFLLRPPPPGNAENWLSAEIDDGIDADTPRTFSLPLPPGIPAYRELIEQGGFGTLYLLIGGLPEGVRPNTANVSVAYTLIGRATKFRLHTRNQRILPLPGGHAMALIAEVPLGLSQEAVGLLQVEVSGLDPDVVSAVHMPFSVLNFDQNRAILLLQREEIEPIVIPETGQ